MSLSFLRFGGGACADGGLVYATLTSRVWKTKKGLRVGDAESRLRGLYPAAAANRDGWWLVTRHACAAVGGQAFGTLKARIGRGHVTGLVVSANVCD
jgi:hypothetical protein